MTKEKIKVYLYTRVSTVCLLSKAVDWYKTCLLNDEKLLNNQENSVRIYEILK